jgi:tetraacyldisaccharide 4'-kinase
MPAWQRALLQAWKGRGPLALALWPISQIYRALFAVRRWLYCCQLLRSHRLPVPVVVIGNVVVGGAGKTPVTIALVQHLQSRGMRVGVVVARPRSPYR